MLTDKERERYSRHLLLPEVGQEGQLRLKESKVLVIGLGGLGAPASLYLAAAGVGTIGLMDGDVVALSNLQRQIIFRTDDVGRLKADAAYDRLRGLNPEISIQPYRDFATRQNILEIVAEFDCVVEGTDTFPARYLINDACRKLNKPYVHGSVYRFEGNVALLGTQNGPCYRCLFPDPPPPELVPSCAESGVLGTVPGMVGVMQASRIIHHILDPEEASDIATWTTMDMSSGIFNSMEVPRDARCPVCSADPASIQLIDYEAFCNGSTVSELDTVEPAELSSRLESATPVFLIDVRSEAERGLGHIGGVHWPIETLREMVALDSIPDEASVIVYCRSGRRSAIAVQMIRDAGHADVQHLKGGLLAWKAQITPQIIL